MKRFNFNDAEDLKVYELIPQGTLAKVKLTIQPGGYNDLLKNYTDGLATQGKTGAIYLRCEFEVQGGEYDKRKIWSLIGLYSPKGPVYEQKGRVFIKSILNSAHGLSIEDVSEEAKKKRTIPNLKSLNNLVFVARIEVAKDEKGNTKNEIRVGITPDNASYNTIMGPKTLIDDDLPF